MFKKSFNNTLVEVLMSNLVNKIDKCATKLLNKLKDS